MGSDETRSLVSEHKLKADEPAFSSGDEEEDNPSLEEVSLVQRITRNRLVPVAVVLLLLGCGLVIWISQRGKGPGIVKAANREPLPPGMKQCLIYGDPHVANYDHTVPEPSFHGAGEYWLTKSIDGKAVQIQGQFSIPELGKARTALTHIAISGDFIGNRMILVGPLEGGDILLDGKAILKKFPSAYFLPNGLGTFTYNDVGVEVDTETFGWDKKVVTVRFTRGVSISIFRWKNFLDARIRMPGNVPTIGVCGNNNAVGEDDSTEAVYQQGGVRVVASKSFFPANVNPALSKAAKQLLAECDPALMEEAKVLCEESADMSPDEQKQCEIDICTGKDEHNEGPAEGSAAATGIGTDTVPATGVATGIPTGIATAPPGGIATGIPTGIAATPPGGITTGIPTGIAAAPPGGIATGIPTEIASALPGGVATGIPTGIATVPPGSIATSIPTGIGGSSI